MRNCDPPHFICLVALGPFCFKVTLQSLPPTYRLLIGHRWMKWMETMGMSMAMSPDESAVWWHYLWVVPCTDLHRVPDSESTSALVSHKWPSSARTRCCSFCHRSRKSAKVARTWFVANKRVVKRWKLSMNSMQSSQIAAILSLIHLEKLQSEPFPGSQSMTGPVRVL